MNNGLSPSPEQEVALALESILVSPQADYEKAIQDYIASISISLLGPLNNLDLDSSTIQHSMLKFDSIQNHLRAIMAALNMCIVHIHVMDSSPLL